MYDGQYDESMSHLENDTNSYELFEMQQCPDFYWMVSEYYKELPMPGSGFFRKMNAKVLVN